MTISSLSHYNIRAPAALLEQVRAFYCEVLGLRVGPRPSFNSRGYWLYAGERDILHLSTELAAAGDGQAQATGWLDHIAFSCQGLKETRMRLDTLGIAYEVGGVATLGQVQLFLTDPSGLGVELTFTEAAT